jgi:hydroxyethylthiazole kinase-like uncharacterized protein yjeF
MGQALYSVAELRALEQTAQAQLTAGALMQRAGESAAAIVAAGLPGAHSRVRVLCGPGNNGGDGYVCAAELMQRGVQVQCVALAPAATDDARAAFARWAALGGVTTTQLSTEDRFDAVIDAIFGIGATRPLAGDYLLAMQWINRQPAPVFALDVPSGLDADRGCWVGGVAGVKATTTVTFIGAKPGLYTGDGCDAAGRVMVEPIGVAPSTSRGSLLAPDDFAALCTPRARNSHKGSFGRVAVVGGNVGMVGAALLAARAALRLGAGRVYVDCIGAPEMRLDPLQPELMFRPLAGVGTPSACVVGCGLGDDGNARAALAAALGVDTPLVIDADALNLLAADAGLAAVCRARQRTTVLTPHPLEAARLLRIEPARVQADRIGHALALAHDFGALVVLKGAGSLVARPNGHYAINPTGSPALASAGSGDVLAGMIGALIGQSTEPLTAVAAATWLHGAAADDFGADIGMVAGDIAPLAARRLARLRAAR